MRRPLLLAAFLIAAAASLPAQAIEIYGTLSDIHATNVPVEVLLPCPVFSCPSIGTTSTNSFSEGGGITLNLLRLPVVKLGVDLRGSKHQGANGADLGLAGIKLTIHPPFFNIRPYLQASAGYLGTTTTRAGLTRSDNYVATELLAGLDLPLIRILDLRVIEIGGGHALTSSGGSKPTFATAGAGLVLHF